MAAEQGIAYVIPNGTGTPEWQRNAGEIYVVELSDGVIEVHDPLFEQPYRFGDQSLVKDEATDRIVVEVWRHFTYMMDSRQMGHTERHAVMDGGGRMSRMPHMLSCAALAAVYGGSPREITTMATHDAPHRVWGHPVDHMLRPLGPQTAHDADQPGFLVRSGFVARLQAAGLCDATGMLANGVHISELQVEEDDGLGISSHSTQSRLLDLDRWGYNLMQELTTPGGIARARAQLADVSRVNDPEYGDQLVFSSVDQAEEFGLRQADRWYRYWASRENLVLSQLLQMLTRHVLTADHPSAAPYQRYFPGDALRALAHDWEATVQEMAATDPGVSGLLKIMDGLAEHTRRHNTARNDVRVPYEGPSFPTWATMHGYQGKLSDTSPSVHTGRVSEYLVVRSNAGKERLVDPFVGEAGDMQRMYAAKPDIKEQIDRDSQWAVRGFGVTIDLNHARIGLTPQERKAIKAMTAPGAARRWQKALGRPEMSPVELQTHIQALNLRYRQIGAISVAPLAELAA